MPLTKKMQIIDDNLKNLESDKVFELSELRLQESNILKDFYKEAYVVIGPGVDEKNPKMYRLVFIKKSNQINPDYGIQNA